MATIVVGVDGPDPSRQALVFAAEEASLRHASLRVVGAWTLPPSVSYAGGFAPSIKSVVKAFHDEARHAVDDAVAEVRRLHPEVKVEGRGERSAAKARFDQARGALRSSSGVAGAVGFEPAPGLGVESSRRFTMRRAPCRYPWLIYLPRCASPPRPRGMGFEALGDFCV